MRFVVVQIDDNDEALNFMKAVIQGNILYAVVSNPDAAGPDQEYQWRHLESMGEDAVPAVWPVPTKMCECPKRYPEARSKKYGWYCCTNCSKPRAGAMQHPHNLLEVSTPPEAKVYFVSFRADRRGYRIYEEPPRG